MKATSVALSVASATDARCLAAMSRDLIEAGLGWNYQPARVRGLIADREMATVVARSGTVIAGFGMMKFVGEHAHLVLLAVCPAFQRQGVGTAIVDWFGASALIAGTASIHLELRALNVGAYRFYRANGFAETLRLPGYYSGRETAVRMIRMLRMPAPMAR